MQPLVSVCIPTFHEEKYIVETLKNLASQTVFNQAEIVIADYDPDKTKSTYNTIFDSLRTDFRFAEKIKFLQVFKSGIGIARHIASNVAAGQYIVTMDADSRFAKNDSIATIIAMMIAKNFKMVHCSNVIKPEELNNLHATEANQLYLWRNEILNPYLPLLAFEPGMTITNEAYHSTTGWPDVIAGEGPIFGWKCALAFGLDKVYHAQDITVFVSSRRALGSKSGIILDLNYHHAYR